MKTLLFPFLFLALHSFSQIDSVNQEKNAFSFDETCSRLWWTDNKMGGYAGFEFRQNGDLRLLNHDAFTGEKWWIEGEHLFVEVRSRSKENIFRTDYLIKKQTSDLLVLSPISVDKSLNINSEISYSYETISNENFTDKLTGHWDGEGESYIQVIPINNFRFQLLISESMKEPVEKFEGFLDKKNKRIVVYLERERKEMTIFFEAGKETISIAGKTYSGKCK